MSSTNAVRSRIVCDRCDGVGWYEGGTAILTHCEMCDGFGWRYAEPGLTRAPLEQRPRAGEGVNLVANLNCELSRLKLEYSKVIDQLEQLRQLKKEHGKMEPIPVSYFRWAIADPIQPDGLRRTSQYSADCGKSVLLFNAEEMANEEAKAFNSSVIKCEVTIVPLDQVPV